MLLSKSTSALTLGVLGGVGFGILSEEEKYKSENIQTIKRLELAILSIASFQYIISFSFEYRRLQKWRYLDWIITTPLLLRTFYLLAVEVGFQESFVPALAADLVMISGGYLAEYPELFPEVSRETSYIVSFGAMLVVLFYINKWDKFIRSKGVDTGRLPYYFYIGWVSYGVNFLNPNEEFRQILFNVLDLVTKGFYSLELNSVLSRNFAKFKIE